MASRLGHDEFKAKSPSTFVGLRRDKPRGDAKKFSGFPCVLASWRLCVEECFTLSLIPAFSRRRIVLRLTEIRATGFAGEVFANQRVRMLFLLPGGEGKDEGERHNHLKPFVTVRGKEVRLNARPHPALSSEERENRTPSHRNSSGWICRTARHQIRPLPPLKPQAWPSPGTDVSACREVPRDASPLPGLSNSSRRHGSTNRADNARKRPRTDCTSARRK